MNASADSLPMTTGGPSGDDDDPVQTRKFNRIRRLLTATLWALFIGLCIIEVVYIPIFGADGTGEPVPRWQMRPSDLLCHLAYSVSPSLVRPVELIFLWGIGLGAYFGFRTVSRKTVLDQTTRSRVFDAIREQPGIHFNALRERTGTNRGTLRYHLSILLLTQKISRIDDGVYTRYLPWEPEREEFDRVVACRYRNGSDRKIIAYLLDFPDATQREVAQAAGVSPSVVSGRVSRLSRERIVTVRRSGRATRLTLTPEAVEAIGRIQEPEMSGLRPPGSIPDSAV
jgi:predicted transcriptional regulator